MERETPSHAVPAEALILHRALAGTPHPRLVSLSPDDSDGHAIAHALGTVLSDGSTGPDTASSAIHVVLARDEDAAAAAAFASGNGAWVVALRQARPDTRPWPGWHGEVLAAGYLPCQFTGTWRLYVAPDRADAIGTPLSYPALTAADRQPPADELRADLIAWRAKALEGWAEASLLNSCASTGPADDGTRAEELRALRAELDAMRATVSWRVTRPLRAVRSLGRTARR
jgi:hypothetical protein